MTVRAYRQRRRWDHIGRATAESHRASLMKCAKCSAKISPADSFCGECGHPVAVAVAPALPVDMEVCPNFGTKPVPDQRFCGSCGQELSGALPSHHAEEKTAFNAPHGQQTGISEQIRAGNDKYEGGKHALFRVW